MRKALFILFCLMSPVFVLSEEVNSDSQEPLRDEQDVPSFILGNPLKGLFKFVITTNYPIKNKESQQTIIKELEKYGTIKKIELSENLNLEEVFEGDFLSFDIKDLLFIDKDLVREDRASLNLKTSVVIEKTKQHSFSYIWSSNCFLEGDPKQNIEKKVSKAFNELLRRFMQDYTLANPDQKPVFYIYQ